MNGLPGLGSINALTGQDSSFDDIKFKVSAQCVNGQTPSNRRILVTSNRGKSWCGQRTSALTAGTKPYVLKGSTIPYKCILTLIARWPNLWS